MAKNWTPPEAKKQQGGFVPPEVAAKNQTKNVQPEGEELILRQEDGEEIPQYIKKQEEFDINEVFNPTKKAQEAVVAEDGADIAENEPEKEKPKLNFTPETEGNDRYKQAGFSGISNIISGYDTSIQEKQKAASEIEAKMNTAPMSMGVSMGGNTATREDEKRLNVLNKEVEALKKIRRIYSDKKDFIDLEYGAEMVGEDASKTKSLYDEEKKLEGDKWEFFARNLPSFRDLSENDIREWMDENMPDADSETKDLIIGKSKDGKTTNILPRAGIFKDATIKQWAKERLEKSIDEELQKSDTRVKGKTESFQAEFAKDLEDTNAYIAQINEAFASNALSEEEYTKLYSDAKISFDKQTVETSKRQEEFAMAANGYRETLRDIAIINQFDNQDWLEANIKSFGNEWIKTPRELAGVVKATAPIIAHLNAVANSPGYAMDAMSGGENFADAYENSKDATIRDLLDVYEPLTSVMTGLSERNLLRVDTDRNLYTGQIMGQLSKIIPASMVAPIAALTVTAGMSFDEMYQSAKEAGLSEEEAVEMGAVYMPIGAALEMSGAGGVIANMGKKRVLATAIDVMKQEGLRSIGKKEATIAMNRGLARELGTDILGGFHSEGWTEALQSTAMTGLQLAKSVEKDGNVFKLSARSVVEDIRDSYMIGGIAGGTISGVSTAFNVGLGKTNIQNIPYELYKQSVLDPKVSTRMIERVTTDKTLSQEQKNAALATMKRDRETFQEVTGLGLKPEAEKAAVTLVAQKKVLEDYIEGKDKALTKSSQEAIKNIEIQLEAIGRTNSQSVAKTTETETQTAEEIVEETVVEPEIVAEETVVEETKDDTESEITKIGSEIADLEKEVKRLDDIGDKGMTLDGFKEFVKDPLANKYGKKIDELNSLRSRRNDLIHDKYSKIESDESNEALNDIYNKADFDFDRYNELSNKGKLTKNEDKEFIKLTDSYNDLVDELDASKLKAIAKAEETEGKESGLKDGEVVTEETVVETESKPIGESKVDVSNEQEQGEQVKEKPKRTKQEVANRFDLNTDGTPKNDRFSFKFFRRNTSFASNGTKVTTNLKEEIIKAMDNLKEVGSMLNDPELQGGIDFLQQKLDILIELQSLKNVTEQQRETKTAELKKKRDETDILAKDAYIGWADGFRDIIDKARKRNKEDMFEGQLRQSLKVGINTLSDFMYEKYHGSHKIGEKPKTSFNQNITPELTKSSAKLLPTRETNTEPTPTKESKTVSESETSKKPPISKKETTQEKKQKAFDSIDKVATLFKDILGADLPEGTKTQGITEKQLIDLGAKVAKALISPVIDLQAAVNQVIAKLKANNVLDGFDESKIINGIISAVGAQPKITTTTMESHAAKTEAQAKLSGIKVALIPEGKRETFGTEKLSFERLLELGRTAWNTGAINPMSLIGEFKAAKIETARGLSPTEVGVMIHYKASLDAKSAELSQKKAELEKAKSKAGAKESIEIDEQIDSVNMDIVVNDAAIHDFHEFSHITGIASSRSFAMRQFMLESEYSATYQTMKVVKELGDVERTEKEQIKFEAEFEALKEKFAQLEKDLKDLDSENKKIQESNKELEQKLYTLNKNPKKKVTASKAAAKRIAEAIRSAKWQMPEGMARLSSSPLPIAQAAWNVSIEAAAKAIDLAGAGADLIETGVKAGVKALKGTKWYKGLSKEGQKSAETELGKQVNDFVDKQINNDVPEITRDEQGNLVIPFKYLSDLVESGFDTIETATAEITRRLKENGEKNITETEVMNAVADYRDISQKAPNEIREAVNKMKSVGLLMAKLRDIQNNKLPLKKGKARRPLERQERRLKREINEAMKDIQLNGDDALKLWNESLDKVKTRFEREIEVTQDKIAAVKKAQAEGKKLPKTSPVRLKLDVEAQVLEQQVKALKEEYKALMADPDLDAKQRVAIAEKAIEKSIERMREQLASGNYQPLSSTGRVYTSPKLEKLRATRDDLQKQRDELKKDSDYYKNKQAQKREKALEARIEKLNAQISGQEEIGTKKKIAEPQRTAHEKVLREQIKAREAVLKETKQYKEYADKKYDDMAKKAAQRKIKEYAAILKEYGETGKFSEHQERKKNLSEETKALRRKQEKIKAQVDLAREQFLLKERPFANRFIENGMHVMNLPRQLMASFDLSAVLRQGLPLGVANPRAAGKAIVDMFKNSWNQEKSDAFTEALMDSKSYELAKASKLYIARPNAKLSAQEELFANRLANKLPWVRVSGNLYNNYLNSLKMQIFEGFSEKLLREGYDPSTKEGKKVFGDLARLINNLSGRGTTFLSDGQQSNMIMSTLMFAPNYMISRFNVVGNMLSGYMFYDPRIRREAWRTIGTYLGAGMAVLMLAKMAGAEVEDDPVSSDFGKIVIGGNIRIDLFAGFIQVARLFAVTAFGETKSIKTGKVTELNQQGYMKPTIGSAWGRFARSKASPSAGALIDWMNREKGLAKTHEVMGMSFDSKVYFQNLVGENQTIPEKILSFGLPLSVTDIYGIGEGEGWGTAGALLPLALGGVGVQYIDFDKKKKGNVIENITEDDLNLEFDDAEFEDDMEFDQSYELEL